MWTYFDQWINKYNKYFPKTIRFSQSLIMDCLQITVNNCHLWLFAKFIQTQKRYPTSYAKKSILTWRLFVISNFFLWTKLLNDMLLAKYTIFFIRKPFFWHIFLTHCQKLGSHFLNIFLNFYLIIFFNSLFN